VSFFIGLLAKLSRDLDDFLGMCGTCTPCPPPKKKNQFNLFGDPDKGSDPEMHSLCRHFWLFVLSGHHRTSPNPSPQLTTTDFISLQFYAAKRVAVAIACAFTTHE